MNLVIIGTIGLDDVETPFGKVVSALGGSGVYSSIAASFFTNPGLISVMGDDIPKEYINLLGKRKIDITGVKKTGKTFHWSGFYEFDMNEAKTLKTELNSLADFKPSIPDNYKEAKFLFLANIDPDLQLEVLSQMNNKPFVVTDTMNYWIESKKNSLLEVIKKTDLFVLNEGEARQLFNTPNLIKAGRQALKMGAKYIVIKKGEHGALLFSDDKYFSAPGYPLEEVKDPTGAGDSFAGGLVGYLSQTGDISETNIRKAIIYGSTIASFCAEDFSLNYLKNISNKEIEERYGIFEQIRKF
ncbi:MAG: PfkB family carbohydrate kinase [Patescibacteria group bacterium]